jgi:hypothetical protein
MSRIIRFPILIGALAFVSFAAAVGPENSKVASAQDIWVPSAPQAYYGTPQQHYSTAQPYYGVPQPYFRSAQPYPSSYHYSAYRSGYTNLNQQGFRAYGAPNYGPVVYANDPFVHGTPGMFASAAPSLFPGTSYGPVTRVMRYGGNGYAPLYAPTSARYYSPYGYRRY